MKKGDCGWLCWSVNMSKQGHISNIGGGGAMGAGLRMVWKRTNHQSPRPILLLSTEWAYTKPRRCTHSWGLTALTWWLAMSIMPLDLGLSVFYSTLFSLFIKCCCRIVYYMFYYFISHQTIMLSDHWKLIFYTVTCSHYWLQMSNFAKLIAYNKESVFFSIKNQVLKSSILKRCLESNLNSLNADWKGSYFDNTFCKQVNRIFIFLWFTEKALGYFSE